VGRRNGFINVMKQWVEEPLIILRRREHCPCQVTVFLKKIVRK